MDRAMPGRIEHFPGVPEAIVKRISEAMEAPEVVKALAATPDQGEPSFAAPRRERPPTPASPWCSSVPSSLPTPGTCLSAITSTGWPMVADHPYRATLEAHATRPAG